MSLPSLRLSGAASWLRRLVVWKFGVRRVPLRAQHFELSLISPIDESAGSTSRDLIDLCLRAAQKAADVDLRGLHERSATARRYLSIFPGEHYHLLAALVGCLNPQRVVEVGTYTGLSALTMLTTLDAGAKLITYDIIPWQQIKGSALRSEDFAGGRLEQRIGNLADPALFASNQDVIGEADLIFVDGPK
ncbi:MAG: hypothetical protein ACREOM_01840, partial [Candidatus Dormibacteraceae bacterium]